MASNFTCRSLTNTAQWQKSLWNHRLSCQDHCCKILFVLLRLDHANISSIDFGIALYMLNSQSSQSFEGKAIALASWQSQGEGDILRWKLHAADCICTVEEAMQVGVNYMLLGFGTDVPWKWQGRPSASWCVGEQRQSAQVFSWSCACCRGLLLRLCEPVNQAQEFVAAHTPEHTLGFK